MSRNCHALAVDGDDDDCIKNNMLVAALEHTSTIQKAI